MNTSTSKKFSTYRLAAIGLMAAVAFVSNYITIPIGDITRIHFGNPFCVLAGLMLGPVSGGLAGGIGAFFYDLTNPLYASGALITLFNKFFIGFFAGLISHRGDCHGDKFSLNLIGSIVGSLAYMVLYLTKSFIKEYFIIRNPMETVMTKLAIKAGSSFTNAVIAVVVSMILAPIFLSAMKRAGIYDKLFPKKKA